MSTTKDTKPIVATLIVFGTPKGAKAPHAVWFRTGYTDRAASAARRHGLATIRVESAATRAVAATLKEGELKAGGQLVMPCVTQDTLNRLRALVPVPPETPGNSPGGSVTVGVQVPVAVWDTLKPCDLVLAADLDKNGEPDGWYEATIMKIENGVYVVRWYYEPTMPFVRLRRQHIALMYPG
jgi:hypothetical protein